MPNNDTPISDHVGTMNLLITCFLHPDDANLALFEDVINALDADEARTVLSACIGVLGAAFTAFAAVLGVSVDDLVANMATTMQQLSSGMTVGDLGGAVE